MTRIAQEKNTSYGLVIFNFTHGDVSCDRDGGGVYAHTYIHTYVHTCTMSGGTDTGVHRPQW